jgi:hypothetical protein
MNLKTSFYTLASIILILASPSFGQAQGSFFGSDTLSLFSPVPRLSVGYMFPSGPTTLKLVKVDEEAPWRIQSYKLQGIWAEWAIPVRTPSPLGFEISGGYLFRGNTQSQETYPPGWYDSNNGLTGMREWGTSTQMVNFQAAVTYRFTSSFYGILGFRYDSFMTKFSNPAYLDVGVQNLADLTINFDIPFFGIGYTRTLRFGGTVDTGLIGLPTLPGELEYKEGGTEGFSLSRTEFMSGYFLEGWAGLSFPVLSWIQVGAFSKYSGVYGKTNGRTSGDVTFSDKSPESGKSNAIFESGAWIVGGSVSTSF